MIYGVEVIQSGSGLSNVNIRQYFIPKADAFYYAPGDVVSLDAPSATEKRPALTVKRYATGDTKLVGVVLDANLSNLRSSAFEERKDNDIPETKTNDFYPKVQSFSADHIVRIKAKDTVNIDETMLGRAVTIDWIDENVGSQVDVVLAYAAAGEATAPFVMFEVEKPGMGGVALYRVNPKILVNAGV